MTLRLSAPALRSPLGLLLAGEAPPPASPIVPQDLQLPGLLASGFGPALLATYRQTPHQARAVQTVEALLLAMDSLFRRHGLAGMSMEAAVREANVTQQAAYRYFENSDHLIRAVVRYLQARMMAELMRRMAVRRFDSVAELAGFSVTTADAVFARTVARYPADWHSIYRTHHEVFYDGAGLLAAETRAALIRSGLADAATPAAPIAVGIAGMYGALKLLRRQEPDMSAQPAETRAGIIRSYGATLATSLTPPPAWEGLRLAAGKPGWR